ncbi:putative shikimate O-hydroxycinnamoyltransferase [Rosa chinensis]|uniref:Putative shikimate O-hydroxycinnamoyltransferase n=1 Tax=Rosa chinensis TaxID=74649 RepID=A0A2P6R9A0_ROSCH|nr:BAHD acyltransferase DCR [Rosa chinensis]PRQ43002.1 putative shikimate O-hydroxycinnamoyltransferase [Rosa chinensis]
MPSSSSSVTVVSKCTVYPNQKSTIKSLKLSVSDLPMLSCHYIQKGVLFNSPPYSINDLVNSLKQSLSVALTHFPALAGRFQTDSDGYVHILCNNAGADFIQAKAKHLTVDGVLPPNCDVPHCFKEFFTLDRTISYSGHDKPLAAVQVTELADGVFIGCTVNHSVTDGTSFWHFFNTFAEINRGALKISKSPDFSRDTVFNSSAVLRVPEGGPKITFSGNEPLRERIFHFTRESILKLKFRANNNAARNGFSESAEIFGKARNDTWDPASRDNNGSAKARTEISSFQSLSAQLWRSVTRARSLDRSKPTTFRMAVNCRHRLEPKMDSHYFGNAIQSIPTIATVGDLLSHDLRWGADLLHKNVVAHDSDTVRRGVEDWESAPRLFPLGNFDGASMTMGSSPRFPMYNNDFGWGLPLAVRSGRANKFDGKISAFPGREGNGSVDLEVVLAPETMAGLECDEEFMQYVTVV